MANRIVPTARNESTYLTLAQTSDDKRHGCPYFKTYGFEGDYINDEHARLAAHLQPTGMIEYGIEGWLLAADAQKLYEMAFFADGNILELGTYRGLSAAVMCAAVHASGGSGQIISVDLDLHSPEAAKRSLADRPGADRAHFFVVDGTKAILDQAAAKQTYAFAFIDHSHTYEHVHDACLRLHRVISIGGFALFHDFNDPRNTAKDALDYGVYQGVMDGLDPRLWQFWGIYGCTGLFRRVGDW
jgi:predicted O-methyltransferase YrrM